MLNIFRAVGFSALVLGVAGASGEMLQAAPLPMSLSATAVDPLPPIPQAIPLPASQNESPAPASANDDAVDHAEQAEAKSLTDLVRRHAASETADREHECLADAVYFESKGEPLDGQLAVAKVIMNRAASGRFAATLCGVVMQRGQFSFVRSGTMPAIPRNSANWRTAVAVAHIAMNEMWTPTAASALFFHARRVAPAWRMTRVAAIGNHVFYR